MRLVAEVEPRLALQTMAPKMELGDSPDDADRRQVDLQCVGITGHAGAEVDAVRATDVISDQHFGNIAGVYPEYRQNEEVDGGKPIS